MRDILTCVFCYVVVNCLYMGMLTAGVTVPVKTPLSAHDDTVVKFFFKI